MSQCAHFHFTFLFTFFVFVFIFLLTPICFLDSFLKNGTIRARCRQKQESNKVLDIKRDSLINYTALMIYSVG